MIIVLLLAIWGVGYLAVQEKLGYNIAGNASDLGLSHDDIDASILSWAYTTTPDIQIDGVPAEENFWLLHEVVNLTGDASSVGFTSWSHLLFAKHTILADLYERTQRPELLPYMIEYAIQIYDYSDAATYLVRLQEVDPNATLLAPARFLFLALNTIDLNFKNIDDLKQTIQRFYDEQKIDKDTFTFYDAAVTFAKKDLNNFSYFMDNLQTSTAYADRYKGFQEDKARAESYPDVKDYYLQALVALRFFQHGYPNIANTVGKIILEKDSKYLLAHQLVAYSSLMLWHREDAQHELDLLTSLDASNKETYLFYKGIALYMAWAYDQALFSLTQVRDESLRHDTLRYILLSYEHLQDRKKRSETAQSLAALPSLDVYDYFSLFDSLFFGERKEEVRKTYDDAQMRTLLLQCYEKLPREYAYVCLYGKAGYFMQQGDTEKSYRYLEQLAVRYPLPEIFEKLGILATQLDRKEDAKKRYAQAILSSSNAYQTAALKETFADLLRK